jgi:PPOX class probable F420-dependent enzyme
MVEVTTAAQAPPAVREFLARPRFAVIATINPDGSPHQAVVWYLLDDDGVILNSKVGRRWPSNAQRFPRVSITVEEGLDYAVLSGTLEKIADGELAQQHIVTMGLRYEGPEGVARRTPVWQTQERVSFRLILRRAEMRKG